ncbi:pectinesterase inhibitor isoform X1 [Eutrema salsugineum]|uniref:pectinesterase inhibitor isoform X1 n=1 Tax=Eutrema salsugineum TaxID=72664 RepID=UPI000CECEE4A|nr:pectinesterase inhibitor isoform X1 [Eutrema salsugineum]
MRMMIMKFLVVITLVVVSNTPMSIKAEKDLMIRECHNARVPTICMQCLESDSSSIHADPVGLAAIIINCLDSHLHILTNNITTLLSKIEKGHDAIKTALEGCKKDLSEAITKALPDAKNSLKTGDYDKAGKSVKLALGFPLSCSDSLQTTKFDFRSFYNRIRIYAQLSNAAMRIIDRF